MSRFLSPPIFSDSEKTYLADNIYKLITGSAALVTIISIFDLFILPQNLIRWLITLCIFDFTSLGLLFLNSKGYTRITSTIFIILSILIIFVLAWTAGGIQSPAIYDLLFIVLIIALLFGWRKSLLFALWVIAACYGLVLAGQFRLLPASSVVQNPLSLWGTFSFQLSLLVFFQYLMVGNLNRAIRQTQQELTMRKITELRYRSLAENMPDIIAEFDYDTRYLFINSSITKLTGQKPDEFIGKKLDEVGEFTREQCEFRKGIIKNIFRTKLSFESEFEVIVPDGKRIYEWRVYPVIGSTGEVQSALSINRDITERKLAEETLMQSEQKYRSIYENAFCGIFQSTSESRFISVNPALVKMFGYASAEEMITTITEIGQQIYADPEEREKITQEVSKNGFIENYELKCRRKNGQIIWVLININVMRDNAGVFKNYEGILLDITERQKVEDELKKSKEKYFNLFNNSEIGMFRTRLDGSEILEFNEKYLKILNYSHEEVKGKPSINLWADKGEREKMVKILNTEGHVTDFEFDLLNKQGEVRKCITSLHLFRDSGIVEGSVYDITDRIRIEEALERKKIEFQTILDTAPVMVAYKSKDDHFISVNSSFAEFVGMPKEEIIGKTTFDIIKQPDVARQGREHDLEVIRTGTPVLNQLVKWSGINSKKERWGFYSKLPFHDTDGSIIGTVSYIQDIDERVRAEEALRESEERFRKLFEEHSAVKLLVDFTTGNIVDANKAATQFYGWTKEELLNMSIDELNILPHEEIMDEMYKAKSRTKNHFEFHHRLRNGNIRDVEVFSSQFIIGGKEYLHSIVHDITDRKSAEEELLLYRNHLEESVRERTKELNQANEELQQMIEREKEIERLLNESLKKEKEISEMKTNFISIASHEFRTPLTTILSSAELLELYYKKWEEVKIMSHYRKIKGSVQNMIEILDEVLTISRSDRGKIEFNPSALNLRNFSEEIIEQVKLQALPKHNIIFNYRLSYQKILADPKLLNHILSNLLTNAVKFSPEGGDVSLSVEDEKEFIKFIIEDNGIGIPPEAANNLFEPFFRARNSIDIKGTGLGLSIVKRYVELHNGEISFESQPGKGAKFFVKIKKEDIN
jgi:PAS domain S-box-containing protein